MKKTVKTNPSEEAYKYEETSSVCVNYKKTDFLKTLILLFDIVQCQKKV